MTDDKWVSEENKIDDRMNSLDDTDVLRPLGQTNTQRYDE